MHFCFFFFFPILLRRQKQQTVIREIHCQRLIPRMRRREAAFSKDNTPIFFPFSSGPPPSNQKARCRYGRERTMFLFHMPGLSREGERGPIMPPQGRRRRRRWKGEGLELSLWGRGGREGHRGIGGGEEGIAPPPPQ